MGACLGRRSSRDKSTDNLGPNVHAVINIDDLGRFLWVGKIEITRTELILLRQDRNPTRWPLKSLRRYGYDADLFSFEAGRRCDTGEGIYAFRCSTAESLFRLLQLNIQQSANEESIGSLFNTVAPTSNDFNYITPNSRHPLRISPSVCSDGTINHSIDVGSNEVDGDGNYLEPIPTSRAARSLSFFHSLGNNGHMPNTPDSPGSINNILEVTSLNPLPNYTNTGVSNIYQEVPLRAESSSSREKTAKKLSLDIPPQEQAPPVNLDAASVSASPSDKASSSQKNNNVFAMPASPSRSLHNESAEAIPTYMNVQPGDMTPKLSASDERPFSLRSSSSVSHSTSFGSASFARANFSSDANHCYENLEPSEVRPMLLRSEQPRRQSRNDVLNKMDSFATSPTTNSSDKSSEPSTPVARRVNYIVLDLDQPHSQNGSATTPASSTSPEVNPKAATPSSANTSPVRTGSSNSGMIQSASISSTNATGIASLLPPESPKRGVFDYATIDFNKTVALSNSTAPSIDCEGSRRTRHSSTAVPNISTSGTAPSHSNSISD